MTAAGQLTGTSAAAARVEQLAALQAGHGEPVLLLPGFTGSKEDFAPILDAVAAAGFAVTALDLPGQFQSPGPEEPAAYSPPALAATVCRVAGRLGGRVHLLGHSYGGLVARAAVLADASAFASLVLMSSGPSAITGTRRDTIDALEPVLPAVGLAGVYAEMERRSAADPASVPPPPELAEFLRRRFLQSSPAMLVGMSRALRAEQDRTPQLAAALASHALPALVLFGEADDAWPPDIQREMARRLGARVAGIPLARHSPAVENPVATAAALIAFWTGSPRGGLDGRGGRGELYGRDGR